ncbi:MAG: hypothetical protein M1820_010326 [Bogoriella megaspora]|nr:MAG: hypothetical protein M1820_010326 [Bogoriella megaspora]
MHPAWEINDIQLLIFDYLAGADFVRLAQTSRALFAPATNKLWRTIPSFAPFVGCLPLDNRPMRHEDLERMDLYGSKVEYVYMEGTIDCPIKIPPEFTQSKKIRKQAQMQGQRLAKKSWSETWTEMASIRPANSQFLPNLRRVRINHVHEETFIPLLAASITNLNYVYVKMLQERQPESVVKKLLSRCKDAPRLEYVCVQDESYFDLLSAELIASMPLKHLRIHPRIPYVVTAGMDTKKTTLPSAILQKPSLEHLTLHLTRNWYASEIEALKGQCLPNLRTLWLNLTTFISEWCASPCLNQGIDSWTCKPSANAPSWHVNHPYTDGNGCERQSPTFFFDLLDNPQLQLLNIFFPVQGVSGKAFLDVVSAAHRNCRLSQLTELSLSGGGWRPHCWECGQHPEPKITPDQLRQAVKLLLPLPRLKRLRISVAPNFLDVLDMDLYRDIAHGLPALKSLWLGHASFATFTQFTGQSFWECTPLQNLAAFCSLFPDLEAVCVGTIDTTTLKESSHLAHPDWISVGVKSLRVSYWKKGRELETDTVKERVGKCLQTWFPGADCAIERLY